MRDIDLFDTLFWISMLIAVVFVLWWAIGDSPTMNQVIITLLVPTLLGVFNLREKHGERTAEILQNLDSMDGTLQRIEGTLKRMENS